MGKKRKKKSKNIGDKNEAKKSKDSNLFFEWLRENNDIPNKDKNKLDKDSSKPFLKLDKKKYTSQDQEINKSNKSKKDNNEKFDKKKSTDKKDDTYLFFQWLGEDNRTPNKDLKNTDEENDNYKKPFIKKGKNLKKNIKPKHKDFQKFYVEDEKLLEKWLKSNEIIDKDALIKEEEQYMYPPHILDAVRIDFSIDLHGLRVEDALFQLKLFVKDCFNNNLKVVKIIHGKGLHSSGGPKLKKAVKNWLKNEGKAYISFYKTATPKHGGTGAIIVWLK